MYLSLLTAIAPLWWEYVLLITLTYLFQFVYLSEHERNTFSRNLTDEMALGQDDLAKMAETTESLTDEMTLGQDDLAKMAETRQPKESSWLTITTFLKCPWQKGLISCHSYFQVKSMSVWRSTIPLVSNITWKCWNKYWSLDGK